MTSIHIKSSHDPPAHPVKPAGHLLMRQRRATRMCLNQEKRQALAATDSMGVEQRNVKSPSANVSRSLNFRQFSGINRRRTENLYIRLFRNNRPT